MAVASWWIVVSVIAWKNTTRPKDGSKRRCVWSRISLHSTPTGVNHGMGYCVRHITRTATNPATSASRIDTAKIADVISGTNGSKTSGVGHTETSMSMDGEHLDRSRSRRRQNAACSWRRPQYSTRWDFRSTLLTLSEGMNLLC